MIYQHNTLNCKGKLLDLTKPKVMGVLNVTPDSFYDGGKFQSEEGVLIQVEKMISEGADILDIGGMSSRPGARIIEIAEELDRVLPVIQAILKNFPDTLLSIDTVRAQVAKEAVEAGVSIVNDISAGNIDEDMFRTVADLNVPYVLMHMQGKPADMQEKPHYKDVVVDVLDFLIQKVGVLKSLGVKDIIIDPGFGFGKEISHNFRLINQLHAFQILECPILAGFSRKSFIYKTLNVNPKDALSGTIALNMVSLQQGAKILRVHDVKEAVDTINIWNALQNG